MNHSHVPVPAFSLAASHLLPEDRHIFGLHGLGNNQTMGMGQNDLENDLDFSIGLILTTGGIY